MKHDIVRTRPLTTNDTGALNRFYENLSPMTVHARFFVDALPADAVDVGDDRTNVAVVAESISESGVAIIGVARAVAADPSAGIAEIAIVVADEWQGQGMGSALIKRLALDCWRRGISRWHVIRLTGNVRVEQLIERVGTLISREEHGGVVEATYQLEPARVGAT